MNTRITARAALPSDHIHYTILMPELGVEDPILPLDRWASELMPGTLFFEEGAEVVGYAWIAVMADVAYVRHLVIAKNARGRGVGGIMMREIANRMRKAGCSSWALNVKIDNVPAIRLYSSVGFEKAYDASPIKMQWRFVDDLGIPEEKIIARIAEPEEDAALERAFDLPHGRITELRSKAGWVFMRLQDPDKPADARVGIACFQPKFPGTFPFRVARPTLAKNLLDAIRPFRSPDFEHVQVVVEDDAALKNLLVSAGGKVIFEIMHMRGKIPAENT